MDPIITIFASHVFFPKTDEKDGSLDFESSNCKFWVLNREAYNILHDLNIRLINNILLIPEGNRIINDEAYYIRDTNTISNNTKFTPHILVKLRTDGLRFEVMHSIHKYESDVPVRYTLRILNNYERNVTETINKLKMKIHRLEEILKIRDATISMFNKIIKPDGNLVGYEHEPDDKYPNKKTKF